LDKCPEIAIGFFNFALRYLTWHSGSLSFYPDSDRVLEFLCEILNSVDYSENLEETIKLIDEHISYKERLNELRTIIEINKLALPVLPIGKISKIQLIKIFIYPLFGPFVLK